MPIQIKIRMNSKSNIVPLIVTSESKGIPSPSVVSDTKSKDSPTSFNEHEIPPVPNKVPPTSSANHEPEKIISPIPKMSPTSSNLEHKVPPIPRRPLTSFNLYSMLERRLILQQQLEPQEGNSKADPNSKASADATLNASNISTDPYDAVRPQRYRNLVLPPNWYVVGANRVKRQDHKNHGLISFTDLSVTVAESWKKEADDEVKEFCRKIAEGEHARYRKEQEEYKNKYGQDKFLSQKRKYKKRKKAVEADKTIDVNEADKTIDVQTKQPQESAPAPVQNQIIAPTLGEFQNLIQRQQQLRQNYNKQLRHNYNMNQQMFQYLLNNPTNVGTSFNMPIPVRVSFSPQQQGINTNKLHSSGGQVMHNGGTSFNMPIPNGHVPFAPKQNGVCINNSLPSSGGQMIHNSFTSKRSISNRHVPFSPKRNWVNPNSSLPSSGEQMIHDDNSKLCSEPNFGSRLVSNECSASCTSGLKSSVSLSPENNSIQPSEEKLAQTKVGQLLSNSTPEAIHQNPSAVGNTTTESSNDDTNKESSNKVTNKDTNGRWIKYFDRESKKHYYFNTVTSTTQWDEPQSKYGDDVVIYEYEHDTGELVLEI